MTLVAGGRACAGFGSLLENCRDQEGLSWRIIVVSDTTVR
jgi:hypothetical protein